MLQGNAQPLLCNTDVTNSNTEIEIELDKEIDIEHDTDIARKHTKRFIPPSAEDVAAYCHDNGYIIDAEQFVDFYQSKGWVVGRTGMKDWKAAVRRWARDAKQKAAPARELEVLN